MNIWNKRGWFIVYGLIAVALAIFLFNTTIGTSIYSNVIFAKVIILIAAVLFLTALALFKQARLQATESARLKYDHELTNEVSQDFQTRFEIIFHSTNLGIAILNLDGSFSRINQAFCELFGYNTTDMMAVNFYRLISANDMNELHRYMQQIIENNIETHQSEQLCYRKSGEAIWISLTMSLARNNAKKPLYFIIQVQNISLQKNAEERLRHMAYHDALTGLANRNKLEQFVNHMLAASRRHQQNFALMFLDLDRFKNINDTIGHEAGDIVLQIIAERLRSTVRSTDLVARLGGDEFVLVVTDIKRTESIAILAQKILETVLQAIVVKGQELYTTTSIGISLYPYDGQTMQALMKNADLALYRAKEHGRNNYQFYTVEMTGKAQERMSLQNALGHALAKNEFILYYQPKMDLVTRKILGLEALLRWRNKEFSAITPDQIIELAEETGLIIPVSDWVLETACKQLKVWHETGFPQLTMAVNCSGRQFKQNTFADSVFKIINSIGLPASSLEIEVTEKMIMEDPENTLRILYALKDLGVQIVIDDFGTGYWSLNNLRRLSVDRIKIDKTFIKQVTIDETSATITSAIIAMVNKLGIKSVAEGVESREQFNFLVKEGCSEIQGYYLSHPLPEQEMTMFLKHPVPVAESSVQSEETT